APGKLAEREADRVALYERTAERLSAQLEAYPALSSDHEYLQAKRISLEPGVFETPRRSMAIPAFDAASTASSSGKRKAAERNLVLSRSLKIPDSAGLIRIASRAVS